MKTRFDILPMVSVMAAISTASAATLNFPAGAFDSGWISQTTGLASAALQSSGGNSFGRISMILVGTGTLTAPAGGALDPNSLYAVTANIRSSSLLNLGSRMFGVEVLDGAGNVLASRNQSGMVGLLGQDFSVIDTLSPNLAALDGHSSLIGALQILLDSSDQAFRSAALDVVQAAAATSAALDAAHLLADVADGLENPALLDVSAVATELSLDPADPFVAAIADVLTLAGAEPDATAALARVVFEMSDDPALQPVVEGVLAPLVAENALVSDVSNLLLLDLSNPGALTALTSDTARGVLGILDPVVTDFQSVKLIVRTGDSPPAGPLTIRVSAGTTAAVGLTVDFDNVSIDEFALNLPVLGEIGGTVDVGDDGIDVDIDTGGSTGGTDTSGGGGSTDTTGGGTTTDDVAVTAHRHGNPQLRINGRRLIRDAKPVVNVRGRAWADGSGNAIRRVEFQVRAPGESRRMRTARGTGIWRIRLRPDAGRTRVFIRARDLENRRSSVQRVVILRGTD